MMRRFGNEKDIKRSISSHFCSLMEFQVMDYLVSLIRRKNCMQVSKSDNDCWSMSKLSKLFTWTKMILFVSFSALAALLYFSGYITFCYFKPHLVGAQLCLLFPVNAHTVALKPVMRKQLDIIHNIVLCHFASCTSVNCLTCEMVMT